MLRRSLSNSTDSHIQTKHVEEKKKGGGLFSLFKINNGKEDFLRCKKELEENNVNCTDEEIKTALSKYRSVEMAICALSQKEDDNN